MKVSELVKSIRIAINDSNATTYSDYSVLNVVNSVFANVSNFLSKHGSSLVQKDVTLELVDNAAVLPADFVTLISVEDEDGEDIKENKKLVTNGYKIIGNTIKSKVSPLVIRYSYCLPDKFAMDSDVPFPVYFNEYLKKYIVMVLTNNSKDASISILSVIEADLIELISNREHAGVERDMQFYV